MGRNCVALAAIAAFVVMAPAARAAETGLVFVSNERSSTIAILNSEDQVVGSFKSCARPRGIRLTPDRKQLIVGCGSDDTIALYDVRARSW